MPQKKFAPGDNLDQPSEEAQQLPEIFIDDLTKITIIDAAGNKYRLDYGWRQGTFELHPVRA